MNSKRQVSFRITHDEWKELTQLHHDRCIELGRVISKTLFIKELVFGGRLEALR